MANKPERFPQPMRDAIVIALFVGAVTATAANLLNQPVFIAAGFIIFLVIYAVFCAPRLRAYYREQEEANAPYDPDDSYAPILERFAATHNDEELIEGYRLWKMGPYDNVVRLRFLQTAILDMIAAGKIYNVETLMTDARALAEAEGLSERFAVFQAECDRRIAEIAQARLGVAQPPNQGE